MLLKCVRRVQYFIRATLPGVQLDLSIVLSLHDVPHLMRDLEP